MNKALLSIALGICCAAAAQQPEAERASAAPAAELAAEQGALTAAERTAVKKTLLMQALRMREERHRITPENSAQSAALAAELHAPEAFVQMLLSQAEAMHQGGRTAYEHRLAFSKLIERYGIDALAIRLYVEGMEMPPAQARALVDWLPLDEIFDLYKPEPLSEEMIRAQLDAMQSIYVRMEHEYRGVSCKEEADAAADRLKQSLSEWKRIVGLRLLLQQVSAERFLPYRESVLPTARKLVEQKIRLIESAYYGSPRLQAIDYLLAN